VIQLEAETEKKSFTARPVIKIILIAFGWLNVVIGAIGIIVPGLPTTIFLIIALWSFSQSSDRFHKWLYNHRLLGSPVREWTQHGTIPRKAKVLAIFAMSVSLVFILYSTEHWVWPSLASLLMVCVAIYILTRPSY